MGSYIGSAGFGLIHPTTISAAALQDAGFYVDEQDPYNPVRFDAISLAPNFDIPTGRNRMNDIVSLITQWTLLEPEDEESLVFIPPDDLSYDDFLNFAHVQLNQREPWDRRAHHKAFETATTYTEDQLLSHHMAPMLSGMGTNVRAVLYQHALSRAGLNPTPLRDALPNLLPIVNEVTEHAWLQRVDYGTIKDYIGDHPALAEKYPIRKFRQLLWDVVGCEAAIGDWQQFTSEEQRLILYASFYGIEAPERVPYQKGDGLRLQDYEVTVTDIKYEYHTQYLVDNTDNPSREEGEPEPVIAPPPPPPTEPELDDPIVFDPKVTGVCDHLLALMTDEQRTQLKEQAKKEDASPSCRHIGSTEREDTSTSDTVRSRGPSRSHPIYLGKTAIAANRANAFDDFSAVMNVILQGSVREAVALFSSPRWVQRLTRCTTHEDVVGIFRLYHSFCWSDKDDAPTDPVVQTNYGAQKYKKIMRRLEFLEDYTAQHKQYPIDYGEDNFSSDDEEFKLEEPPTPKHRPVVPGDFVLTFNVLALANTFESQFPHRSEYWWTQLPGTLDQACICFSMLVWVDQLATCKDEESLKITYQSFLDTTWQALQGLQQCTGQFPYLRPTEAEAIKAYYMKNRTLILHNQIVWGKEADKDQPVIPSQEEQSRQDSSRRDETSSTQEKRDRSGDHDEDDPNKRRSNANPPSKGDEAQDQEKKEDEKEATAESGEKEQTAAEREALETVKELKRKLKAAQEAARKAAEDKAQRIGEGLAQQVDDERARKQKKKESKKGKKRRKKQKKDGDHLLMMKGILMIPTKRRKKMRNLKVNPKKRVINPQLRRARNLNVKKNPNHKVRKL